ncbi:MAG: sacsin N-terminal ATP-binding-like domain-containing protein [Planctomycetota bacterium]
MSLTPEGPHPDPRSFVDQLRRENERKFDDDIVDGMLGVVMDRAFPHPWIYTCELIQNALDAGADEVNIRTLEGHGLEVSHNGIERLAARHVQAMSRIGLSTKGGGTVGFMGVGFKSVFQRFRRVRIAGGEWRFGFRMREEQRTRYGDVQPVFLDAVLPAWDDEADDLPDGVTRFQFAEPRNCYDHWVPADDWRWLTNDDEPGNSSPTPLAVLALRGLRRLTLDGQTWGIEQEPVARSEQQATPRHLVRISEGVRRWSWLVLEQRYVPDDEAIRSLLSYRHVKKDANLSEYEQPRSVFGFVPLDEGLVPLPREYGDVFATLKTTATLPFGMDVQADWLLNVSRHELKAPDRDPWQVAIVGELPALIASYLRWLAEQPEPAWQSGLGVLNDPSATRGQLRHALAHREWITLLRESVAEVRFVPASAQGTQHLMKPGQVRAIPDALQALAEVPEWRLDALIGGPVYHSVLAGKRAASFIGALKLVTEVDAPDLASHWSSGHGPAQWWELVDEDRRFQALEALWNGVYELMDEEWDELPLVPTAASDWKPAASLRYLNEPMRNIDEEPGSVVAAWLGERLPAPDQRLDDDIWGRLRRTRSEARGWFEGLASEVKLADVVRLAASVLQPGQDDDKVIALGRWARSLDNRHDLLPVVLAEANEVVVIRPPGGVLVADPYVESDLGVARRAVFSDLPVLSRRYLDEEPEAAASDWVTLLENKCGAHGRLALIERVEGQFAHDNQAAAGKCAGTAERVQTAKHYGYRVLDYELSLPERSPCPGLATLLSAESHILDQRRSVRALEASYHGKKTIRGSVPAKWVTQLSSAEWVPIKDGSLVRPADACLSAVDPEDPAESSAIAKLDAELASLLQRAGIAFAPPGRGDALRRLRRLGKRLSGVDLAAAIRDAHEACVPDRTREFADAVTNVTVPVRDGRRVPISRVVASVGRPGVRSSLGHFVVGRNELDQQLADVLAELDLPPSCPATTTGTHALDYLRSVWKSAEEGARKSVASPEVMAAAYEYVLADCADDSALKQDWDRAVDSGLVYCGQKHGWLSPKGELRPLLDDVRNKAIAKAAGDILNAPLASPGHLGRSEEQRLRVADALGLDRLSKASAVRYSQGRPRSAPQEVRDFEALVAMLRQLPDRDDVDLTLVPVQMLSATVRGRTIELAARLDGTQLIVAGSPDEAAPEATTQIVETFRLGDHVPYLMAVVQALGTRKFNSRMADLAMRLDLEVPVPLDKQGHSGGLEDEDPAKASQLLNAVQPDAPKAEDLDAESQGDPTTGFLPAGNQVNGHHPPHSQNQVNTRRGNWRRRELRRPGRAGVPYSNGDNHNAGVTATRSNRPGPRPPRERVAPDRSLWVGTTASNRSPQEVKDDTEARALVIEFENSEGRRAAEAPSLQPGYDVRSDEPRGPLRHIEVKGLQGRWEDNATVQLSLRQFEDARLNDYRDDDGREIEWWVYVVDGLGTDSPRIHLLRNPVLEMRGFLLHASRWVDEVEEIVEFGQ